MSGGAPDSSSIVAPAAVSLLIVLVAFWPSVSGFFEVWSRYNYSHGFLVAPLCAWLVWRKKEILLPPGETFPPAFVFLVGLSVLWLFAVVMQVQVAHLALFPFVLFFWAAAVLGWKVGRPLLPILAIFLLVVPFWEALTPLLQGITTAVSGSVLSLLGITAEIRNHQILLPSGVIEVATECSGLGFFLVGLTLGAFASQLFLKRWRSRLTLVALAGFIAMVSNWIRVAGLTLVGHYTQMESDLLAEHGTFGWVIFTISLVPLFFLGRRIERWDRSLEERRGSPADPAKAGVQEGDPGVGIGEPEGTADQVTMAAAEPAGIEPEGAGEVHAAGPGGAQATEDPGAAEVPGGAETTEGPGAAKAPAAPTAPEDGLPYRAPSLTTRILLATALAVVGPLLFFGVGTLPRAQTPDQELASLVPGDGWQAVESPAPRPYEWEPDFQGASEHERAAFTNGEARLFGDRLVYESQAQGAELIYFANRIAEPRAVLAERLLSPMGSGERWVRETVVGTAEGPVLVWHWYRVGGVETAFEPWAKVLEIVAFFRRSPRAELVALSTLCAPQSCESAFEAMRHFTFGIPPSEEETPSTGTSDESANTSGADTAGTDTAGVEPAVQEDPAGESRAEGTSLTPTS
jgi:EpsI family protein